MYVGVSKHSWTANFTNWSKIREIREICCHRKKPLIRYLSELSKVKESAGIGEELVVHELPMKPRGRPPLLGVKIDNDLQALIKAMRSKGATINSAIVIATGKGLLLKSKRELLYEYGGSITLTKEWAKSVLRRMGCTKRRANSKSKVSVENFAELKTQFLLDIKACIEFEDIPYSMVVNWDQTGLKIVPNSTWTMEQKGTKRVEMVAVDDKRQLTGVFGCSLSGDFLPVQLIYGGKTYQNLSFLLVGMLLIVPITGQTRRQWKAT